jgi:uncharacterized membrane protein
VNDVNGETSHTAPPAIADGLVTLTYIIYGLHALSALGGVLTPAFVVTAFVTGWPSLIAVIINYMKRGEVHGSFLESHFRWQIRTFWFAVMWVMVALLLAMTFIGIPFAFAIAWVAGLWVLYRIARGLFRLLDNRAMPL